MATQSQVRIGWKPYVNLIPSLVTSGLVLNLDVSNTSSYSGTGTTWTDLSGNGLNATLVNGTIYKTANGGHFQFDGINDTAVLAYNTILDPATYLKDLPLTISGWVKFNASGGGTFINKGDNGDAALETYTVYIGSSGLQLRLYTGSAGNYVQIKTTNITLNPGTWYNFSVNYSGGIGTPAYQPNYNGTTKLYINGVEYTTIVTYNGTYTKMVQSAISPTFIGSFGQVGAPGSYWSGSFNGSVAQTLMYNRQLTSTEVLQNYNATKVKFATSYLLDTYTGAAAAYSLRKLRTTYTGPAIRVRRSSDNTEQNIGFDVSGNLDTTSLSSFVGSGNGFVTTWYDQGGNGSDATQTNASSQPQIVLSGVLHTLNGKPIIKTNTTTSTIYFNTPISNIVNRPLSIITTGKIYQLPTNVYSNTTLYVGAMSGGYTWRYNLNATSTNFANGIAGSTTNQNVAAYSTNPFINQAHFGTTTLTNRFNGTDSSMTINDAGQNSSPANFLLMNVHNPFIQITSNMGMFECIFYLNDKTSDRTGIESNINSFYTIY
jgi:hypothetical protein